MKVLLILVDGMRADCLSSIPFAQYLAQRSRYDAGAQTVFPPVTLPCHISLFHSCDPSRHGTTTNTYAPQVRPIDGLCEVIRQAGKTSSVYYSWEELRDISRPGSLSLAVFTNGSTDTYPSVVEQQADLAIQNLRTNPTDFTFFYIPTPDAVGHTYGWESAEYAHSVAHSWAQIERMVSAITGEFTVIVTADHGGHERMHGIDVPEDMTIPLFIYREGTPAQVLAGSNIMDIAPTVAAALGIQPNAEWEGKSLL